jgi:hypothetical protein
MFRLFGSGGAACPRCDHPTDGKAAGLSLSAPGRCCAHCGLVLGAPRHPPILRDNRWLPADDEFAVFFGVRELSGVFSKTLRVPPAARAYILQGEQATEVPQGEYQLEGFFTRLNNLLRSQYAEILITRSAALPVAFELDELPTAEHLRVAATLTVSLRIGEVAPFAQHFMTMPGTVKSAHLRELLAPMLRQALADYTASQSLREMAGNGALRAQLEERLLGALAQPLADFGLAVAAVEAVELRHDKFDANRARVGSAWLLADERRVQLEERRHLDELYTDEEWQRIKREEQEARLRFRRLEMGQDEKIGQAELTLESAERLHALRAREIELYGRVAEARNRKEALARGAGEVLAELEHDLSRKQAERSDEAAEWAHLRAVAGVRMRSELEVARQGVAEAATLARQRFSHQLVQQQIRNRVEQALAIEDASRRHEELTRLRAAERSAAEHQRSLDECERQGALALLRLAQHARQREAERVLEWEEEQGLERKRVLLRDSQLRELEHGEQAESVRQRIDSMRREGAGADALAQHDKLLRTIEADGVQARQALQIELEGEARRQQLRQQQREAEWQHELRRLDLERDARRQQQDHAIELARLELQRMESLGGLNDSAKVALAPAANAAVLADLLKTQVHAGMSPQQLSALGGVVAATNSLTPAEAAQAMAQELERERARHDALSSRERQHEIELLSLRGLAMAPGLSAVPGPGAAPAAAPGLAAPTAAAGAVPLHPHGTSTLVPAAAACANGHPARPGDRFCAACGVALVH